MNDNKNINNSVGGHNYNLDFTSNSSSIDGNLIQTSIPSTQTHVDNFNSIIEEYDLSLTSDIESIKDISSYEEYVEELKTALNDKKSELKSENKSLKESYQKFLSTINFNSESLEIIRQKEAELNSLYGGAYSATSPYAAGIEARASELKNQISKLKEEATLQYINEHPDEFKAVMGMSFDEYNQKIADNEKKITSLGDELYNLKQVAKEIPYLEMMMSDDFSNYLLNYEEHLASYEDEVNKQQITMTATKYLKDFSYYDYLDEGEIAFFNYLYHEVSVSEANDYLWAINDRISKRAGLEDALEFLESITDENGNVDVSMLESTLRSLGEGVEDGFNTTLGNAINYFNIHDDGTKSATEYKKEYMKEIYAMLIDKGELSPLVDNAYNFGSAVGEYLPIALASTLNPSYATYLMAASQAGKAKHNALLDGDTDSILKAYSYGTAVGVQSLVWDKLLFKNKKIDFFQSDEFYKQVITDGTKNALKSITSNVSEDLMKGEFDLGEITVDALESFVAACFAKSMTLAPREAINFLKNTNLEFTIGGEKCSFSLENLLKDTNAKIGTKKIELSPKLKKTWDGLKKELKKIIKKEGKNLQNEVLDLLSDDSDSDAVELSDNGETSGDSDAVELSDNSSFFEVQHTDFNVEYDEFFGDIDLI